MPSSVPLDGDVAEQFAPVADVFRDVLEGQTGTGASLAVRYAGAWVVDLWGGYADVGRTRPWRRDSLVMPYSVTKPFAAVCALLLVDRGLVDLDAPLSTYWPQMTAHTTLRQVLAHRSGHVVLDRPVPEEAFYDWDRLCALLAAEPTAWAPGTAQGEAALFYGHLVGEVVRRVDGRSLGRFLREEVCGPLGLDFHVGLADAELERVVDLTGFGEEFRRRGEEMPELLRRALGNPPGALDPAVVNGDRWRRAEIPAVNGHGTARAVAGFYAALHEGRILTPGLLHEAVSVAGPEPDLVMGDVRSWGLGFSVEPDGWGMGGVGGSVGWWSEDGQYAFSFLTGEIAGHDRNARIEDAVRGCLGLPPL